MKNVFVSFVVGLIFAVGLGIAGMTQPAKVVAFLDVAGDWDPSLAFVMIGAIAVHVVAYRLVLRRPSPLFAARFSLPQRKDVDAPLVLGSALFGVGWGIAGICPGPAFAAVASGAAPFVVFVVAMIGGMVLFRVYERLRADDG